MNGHQAHRLAWAKAQKEGEAYLFRTKDGFFHIATQPPAPQGGWPLVKAYKAGDERPPGASS